MNIRGWLHVNVSPGANVSRVRMSYPGLKNWFVLHVKVTPGLERKPVRVKNTFLFILLSRAVGITIDSFIMDNNSRHFEVS